MSRARGAALAPLFARALAPVCAGHGVTRMAVAYSGGLDSSALLQLAYDYASAHGITLFAFHIHHGISTQADAWLHACEQRCQALGVAFEGRRIVLDKGKSGLEANARKHRYAALGELCRQHQVRLLLTAHHLDDQAETVLLQLLRGSGPAGLSGMDAANSAPTLLGDPELLMARPLLPVARAELEDYVAEHGLSYVEDDSNSDPRFARNALRHSVMPALANAFPGFQERFARSARHAQSAQRMLDELAEQDLAACQLDDSLDLTRLRQLSADRCANLVRHWFVQRGLRMPSTAWLDEMLAQLFDAREDAQLCVTHPDCHIRRHRERLFVTPKLAELAGARDQEDAFLNLPGQAFSWRGEASLAFPAYGGTLHFDPAAQGFEAAWLEAQALEIDFRKGGERLKLGPNRPTRSLKAHYQSLDVPAWERPRLPIVRAGAALLFAAGIGMDCAHTGEGGSRIALRWTA